jgi:hypothetical protein
MDGHKYIERFAIVKESTILFDNVRLLLLLLHIDSLSSQEVFPETLHADVHVQNDVSKPAFDLYVCDVFLQVDKFFTFE